MTYMLLENDNATYAIDWDVVYRIIRGYNRAVARDANSRVVTTSESTWYNPMSWALADIRSLDVNWARVRTATEAGLDRDFNRLAELATRSVPAMARELKWMVAQTARRTNSYIDQLGVLQSDNTARINRAVDTYQQGKEFAQFTRDWSANGLMVGASIATGGAGLALLGGGATLKGWGKYQDTDTLSTDRRVAAAVMTGVGNFMFGAFKLGGTSLSGKEEVVVAIIQAQWESGVALVEGKGLGESLATGSLKLGGPLTDRFFKSGVVKGILERASIPIAITWAGENVAGKVVQKWLGKEAQKEVVERFGKKAIGTVAGGHTEGIPTAASLQGRRSSLLDGATLTDDVLLTLAIVNMDKGIGRGL